MKTRLLIFLLLFVALFAGMACQSGSGFATGANVFDHYGWSSAWLCVHHYRTISVADFGDHRVTERVNRLEGISVTDWSSCFAAAAVSALTVAVLPNHALQRTETGRRASSEFRP